MKTHFMRKKPHLVNVRKCETTALSNSVLSIMSII
jgi:hypothetical protein